MTADPWHSRPAHESAGDARPVDASEDWVRADIPSRREIEHDEAHRRGEWCGSTPCVEYQPAHERGVVSS